MKHIIFMLIVISMVSVNAQRHVEKSVKITNGQTLFLDFQFAENIQVEQWNQKELKVDVSVTIDNGEGNDHFSLILDESNTRIEMRSDFGDYFKEKNKQDRNYWNEKSNVTDIRYTVYVPVNANLEIKSISGDVVAHGYKGVLITDLIAGDVTINSYDGELHLKSISGDLDVTFKNAEVMAKTLTGTIYSNLEIDLEGGDQKSSGHNNIKGTINNGGKLVKMETISGDIFIRKS